MHPGRALIIAREELDKYGLVQWSVRLDNAKRRFGQCRYSSREIRLSRPLVELNNQERVRQTILHEIAHALAGPRTHHGPEWVKQCHNLGIEAKRCFTDEDTVKPQGKYVAICGVCGHEYRAHRLGHRMRAGELFCRHHRGFPENARLRFVIG